MALTLTSCGPAVADDCLPAKALTRDILHFAIGAISAGLLLGNLRPILAVFVWAAG